VHRACRKRVGGVRSTPRQGSKFLTLEDRRAGRVRWKRQCSGCGEFFMMRHDQKYCTKQCADSSRRLYPPGAAQKAASRARKLSKLKTWDGVADAEIFARDAGVCQLGENCKYPGVLIDPEARHPQPLSPSVDHIIPLSYGGIDVAANKRAAHLSCNVGRNNRLSESEKAFMVAHPELVLPPEQLTLLPLRRKRGLKAKTPKPAPVFYESACFWCESPVLRTYRADYVMCGKCPGSTAGCSVCGAKMVIVAGSRPPETRRCRSCPRSEPPPRPQKSCVVCGGPLYANNTIGVCQRTDACKREYGRIYYNK